MRRRSAVTRGRSGSTLMARLFLPPALLKAFLALSTSTATSAGSRLTVSVPVSMRATSSRSVTKSCMWSAWSPMMRKNWRNTAGSRSADESSTVDEEPFMVASGALSSWLTIARNSARRRSSSSTSAMSCMVTTTVSTGPSSERMGVALSSSVTLRPSGTLMTTSSARSVSPGLRVSTTGNSRMETSCPSARLKVSTSMRSSGVWPGSRRLSTIRIASRLKDFGTPMAASKTTTPTGDVSMSVSRSALARRSSRCLRALAMTSAAWEANITRVSSSSLVNSPPPFSRAR